MTCLRVVPGGDDGDGAGVRQDWIESLKHVEHLGGLEQARDGGGGPIAFGAAALVKDEAEAVVVGEAVGFEPERFTLDGAGEVFFGHEFGGDRSDRIAQLLQEATKLLKLHHRQFHRPILPPHQSGIILRLRIPPQPPTLPSF